MELQKRKSNRLSGFDYSASGYYFITICTAEKQKILCNIVGCGIPDAPKTSKSVGANCVRPQIILSKIGQIIKNNIDMLDKTYQTVSVDRYVIMPNHLHLILMIDGRTQFAPTISRVIKQFKGSITKQVGIPIWQKSFYDHIIRDEKDYLRICEYIENNPAKWTEDKYFVL